MDTKNWLTWNSEETLSIALKGVGKTEKQLEDDVTVIKEWLKTQRHLPEISSDSLIRNFLIVNKCSIEKTKQKIDIYYTIRHLLPEIYSNMDLELMKQISKDILLVPLPRRTEEGCRITMAKLMESSADNFDFYKYTCFGLHTIEVRFQEDIIFDDIIIADLVHVKLSHVMRVTPIHLKKMITIMEKVFSNKMRQFHFVNCPSIAVNTINLVKQFMKPKLAQRIFLHSGTETLTNIISPKVLPKDYGGLELSLVELNDLWQEKLMEYKDRLNMIDSLKTNESLRPSVLQNDEILGYHGNFRKLEMD